MTGLSARPMPDVPAERYWSLAEALLSAADVSRTLFDDTGRPLGERYFPPPFRGDAAFEMTPCPYEGSRRGRAMNLSALPGVVRHWDSVITALRALRLEYLGGRAGEATRWIDLWFLGRIATAVPAYLARAAGGGRYPIPAAVAALFKPAIGLYMVAERAFLRGADAEEALTGAAVMDALDHTGALLSDDAACSGPPRLLRALVAVAVNGDDDATHGSKGASTALGGVAAGPLVRYGAAAARLEMARFVYFVDLERRLALLTEAGLLGPAPYRCPSHLRGVPVDPLGMETVERRLRLAATGMGLRVPSPGAGAEPGGRAEHLAYEQRRDLAWVHLLSHLQADVLEALGIHGPPAMVVDDLPRIAAYLARDWRYARSLRRYRVHDRLLCAPEEDCERPLEVP